MRAVLTGGGAVVNAGTVAAGEFVAVVGLGGVELAAVLVARAIGAGEIVAVDPVPDKRRIAEELGATGSRYPDEVDGLQVDCTIEAAGALSAVATALSVTGSGGRTVLVGLTAPGATVLISGRIGLDGLNGALDDLAERGCSGSACCPVPPDDHEI